MVCLCLPCDVSPSLHGGNAYFLVYLVLCDGGECLGAVDKTRHFRMSRVVVAFVQLLITVSTVAIVQTLTLVSYN